jgi:hypothetical protein
LNLRPPGPQPGALPDCATPRGASRAYPNAGQDPGPNKLGAARAVPAAGRPPHLDETAKQATTGSKRATGIEPALEAWKASVQPQHLARGQGTIVSSQPPDNLRGVRLRALVPLLVLTAVDYALWDWSIADGHDILSLGAGLTLLPLAAVSLAGLVLVGARVLRLLLWSASPRAREHTRTRRASRGASPTEHTPHSPAGEPDSPPSRLAA